MAKRSVHWVAVSQTPSPVQSTTSNTCRQVAGSALPIGFIQADSFQSRDNIFWGSWSWAVISLESLNLTISINLRANCNSTFNAFSSSVGSGFHSNEVRLDVKPILFPKIPSSYSSWYQTPFLSKHRQTHQGIRAEYEKIERPRTARTCPARLSADRPWIPSK